VRIVVYLLLAANLIYLAWSGWIGSPAPVPTAKASDPLPELALVSEGFARASTSAPSAIEATSALAQPVTGRSAPAGRCVSVGPFGDLAQAARGAALLQGRGFNPRQRAEQGGTWDGFWVYVGGLESAADETKVMKTLERAGIQDARAMPATDVERRISVGLFSERDRAQKRAQAVRKLGFNAEITERSQTGTVYWVDLDVGNNERAVPTEGLLETSGSRLEIRVCPESEPEAMPARPEALPPDARPAATTADAGVPRPG
jgi:hypothetical protein